MAAVGGRSTGSLEGMFPVHRISEQILEDWAEELSSHIGRSVQDIREKGLSATDFSPLHDLRVSLMDGSFVQFRYAFAVSSEAKRAIAVFTEHCGYHVFPNHEASISELRRHEE